MSLSLEKILKLYYLKAFSCQNNIGKLKIKNFILILILCISCSLNNVIVKNEGLLDTHNLEDHYIYNELEKQGHHPKKLSTKVHFRGDLRSPDQIFKHGFRRKSKEVPLIDTSGFSKNLVSATDSIEVAIGFADVSSNLHNPFYDRIKHSGTKHKKAWVYAFYANYGYDSRNQVKANWARSGNEFAIASAAPDDIIASIEIVPSSHNSIFDYCHDFNKQNAWMNDSYTEIERARIQWQIPVKNFILNPGANSSSKKLKNHPNIKKMISLMHKKYFVLPSQNKRFLPSLNSKYFATSKLQEIISKNYNIPISDTKNLRFDQLLALSKGTSMEKLRIKEYNLQSYDYSVLSDYSRLVRK